MNQINKPITYFLPSNKLSVILIRCEHKPNDSFGHSFYCHANGRALLEYNNINQVVWFYEKVYRIISPTKLYCNIYQVEMEEGTIKNEILEFFQTRHGWKPNKIFRHPGIVSKH